jgi:hypothetical protein
MVKAMYNNASSAAAAGATGAVTTGAFTNPIWAVLAGFAILAAGTAIARIVPRRGTLKKRD